MPLSKESHRIYSLRQANANDIGFIQSCFRASTKEDRAHKRLHSRLGPYAPAAEKMAIATMGDGNWQNWGIIGINAQGNPIGFCRGYHRQDQCSTLHKLYIQPDHRGYHLSRSMIEAFTASAKQVDSHRLIVTLPSDEMLLFYTKLGFSFFKTKPSPKKGKPDLIVMKLDL